MIRFTVIDFTCTIELFKKDEPDHLMSKCHRREREPNVAFGENQFR